MHVDIVPVESRKTIGALEWALDSSKATCVWAGNHSWVFYKCCVDSQPLSHLPSPALCFLTDRPWVQTQPLALPLWSLSRIMPCVSVSLPTLSSLLPSCTPPSFLPLHSPFFGFGLGSAVSVFPFFFFFLPYSNFCFPVCVEHWHREYPPWSRPERVSQSTKGRVRASCCLQASALLLCGVPHKESADKNRGLPCLVSTTAVGSWGATPAPLMTGCLVDLL